MVPNSINLVLGRFSKAFPSHIGERNMRLNQILQVLSTAFLFCGISLTPAYANPISFIPLSQFDMPEVIDFSGFSSGVTPISSSDPIFTSAGLLSVSATSTSAGFAEFYDAITAFNAGTALFATDPISGTPGDPADLLIITPGTTFSFATPEFTFQLNGETNRFGFRAADTSSTFATITTSFFNDNTLIGSLVTGSYDATTFLGFESIESFNRVVVNFSSDGAGVAALTFDGISVPEANAFFILAMGLFALGSWTAMRQRRYFHV